MNEGDAPVEVDQGKWTCPAADAGEEPAQKTDPNNGGHGYNGQP